MIPTAVAFGGPFKAFRWMLECRWGDGPLLGWVLANPSTADDQKNDPTSSKVEGFSRRLGFGGYRIGNAYAYRTPDPTVLRARWKEGKEVLGPENLDYLHRLAADCPAVIVGWGHCLGRMPTDHVLPALADTAVYCLGYTKDRQPRHPLMLKYDTPLEPWSPAC